MRDDGAMTHIKLPNILPEIFQMILRYIYGGRLSLEEYDTSDIIKILIASNDFNTLKNTLQQIIPLIKFYNLTPSEFADKVYPYKKIIPKELRDKLIRDFIIQPSNKPESKTISKEISPESIDSRIITFQHVELISKWIDKLKTTDKLKGNYAENSLLKSRISLKKKGGLQLICFFIEMYLTFGS
ncbi:BTB/POZ protein [Rhizophagus irregularis DAOM 181602=DAOM 197198]|nr:BTB/POZ protein [Rhizophagus irregularis DAOM 181602=DAOM 197198]